MVLKRHPPIRPSGWIFRETDEFQRRKINGYHLLHNINHKTVYTFQTLWQAHLYLYIESTTFRRLIFGIRYVRVGGTVSARIRPENWCSSIIVRVRNLIVPKLCVTAQRNINKILTFFTRNNTTVRVNNIIRKSVYTRSKVWASRSNSIILLKKKSVNDGNGRISKTGSFTG